MARHVKVQLDQRYAATTLRHGQRQDTGQDQRHWWEIEKAEQKGDLGQGDRERLAPDL